MEEIGLVWRKTSVVSVGQGWVGQSMPKEKSVCLSYPHGVGELDEGETRND